MLREALELLGGIAGILMSLNRKVEHRTLNDLIINIRPNIDEYTAEVLKDKLKLVSDEFKKYDTLETTSAYKTKGSAKAREINTELAK